MGQKRRGMLVDQMWTSLSQAWDMGGRGKKAGSGSRPRCVPLGYPPSGQMFRSPLGQALRGDRHLRTRAEGREKGLLSRWYSSAMLASITEAVWRHCLASAGVSPNRMVEREGKLFQKGIDYEFSTENLLRTKRG